MGSIRQLTLGALVGAALLATACSNNSELKAGLNEWCLEELDYEFSTGEAPAGLTLATYCDCISEEIAKSTSSAEKKWYTDYISDPTLGDYSETSESILVSIEDTFAKSSKACGWTQR